MKGAINYYDISTHTMGTEPYIYNGQQVVLTKNICITEDRYIIALIPVIEVIIVCLNSPFDASVSLTPCVQVISKIHLVIQDGDILGEDNLLSVVYIRFCSV